MTTTIRTIQLPAQFYEAERPSVDPNSEAVDYVTDGEQASATRTGTWTGWAAP